MTTDKSDTGASDVFCANCGKAEIDDIKLKDCDKCDLARYCGDECREDHRKTQVAEDIRRLREAPDAGLPEADNSPWCWICLEEGPDRLGEPLVRDCSCRGSSGFAHLSCIVEYAESEGRRIMDTAGTHYAALSIEAFGYCPSCKQEYQNDVIYKLTKAAVDFTDREYKDVSFGRKMYLLYTTLLKRLAVLDPKNNADDKAEGEESCTKILSIIDQMKSNNDIAQDMGELLEAGAYSSVSWFYVLLDTTESLTTAKLYMERSRDMLRGMVNDDENALMSLLLQLEHNVAEIESRISGEENLCVDSLRKMYVHSRRINGETDPYTIDEGVELAEALFLSFHTIEAERLLSKLVKLSRQVHGSEHQCTKSAMTFLLRAKQRHVRLQQNDKPFIALRYKNDGGVCIVRDPTVDDKKVVELSTSAVIPYLGTPVICEGLQQMTHLNGKIGDVRRVDIGTRTCEVHFEEEGLDHAEIDSNNLRIVFDLPSLGA